ncbi:hypothetical protein ACFL00_04525 [Pseudomonadota bacterium]
MKYVHYGRDYGELISKIPTHELRKLGVTESKYSVPANPVVAPNSSKIRIAFFGINAYADPDDYDEIGKFRNFFETKQSDYNRKLFSTIDLYHNGITQSYIDGGSVYFSNFVKIVLRTDLTFKDARAVSSAIKKCPVALNLYKCAVKDEIDGLKKQGCKLFICFGGEANYFVSESSPYRPLIHERHYSRNIPEETKTEIDRINKEFKFLQDN